MEPGAVQSVNPATGETLAEFPCAAPADVCAAIQTARRAQRQWGEAPAGHRARILGRFRDELFAARREVAELVTRESGKPLTESLVTEVLVTLDAAGYFAKHAAELLHPEKVPHSNLATKTKSGRLHYDPVGVVGIIAPWNYPLSTPAGQILAALAAGNAVVLKPSEFTTLAARKLKEIFDRAGLPPGILQVLPGDGATGAALVEAGVDKLIFTGSVATGRRVAAAAAAKLTPVVLELGGKDPMIVLEDADPEFAASGALWGGLMNCGQTCISIERIYVHQRLLRPFLDALRAKMARLKQGNGLDADVEIGPMIRERQVAIVEGHVNAAQAAGAEVLAGGRRRLELGPLFYEPTLLHNVNHGMAVMRDETFGPVLPVMPFRDEDEAVRLANDSEFGLAASVWTADRRRGRRVAARLRTGAVMINDALSYFGICEAPHGGVKSSGIGRTHGRAGLLEMVNLKYVDEDLTGARPKPWWFGYDESQYAALDGFLESLYGRARRRLAALPAAMRALRAKRF